MAFVWRLEAVQERFMKKVRKAENGCWIWQGAICGEYGATSYKGRRTQAHRAAYLLFVGPIPEGHVIRHSCDNGMCVNYEDHLSTGTQKQNVDDMIQRGRRVKGPCPGVMNGRSQLTEDQVVQVLTAEQKFGFRRRLASELGVTVNMIDKIRSGDNWAHVRPDLPRFRYEKVRTGLDNPNCKLSDEEALAIFNAPHVRGSVKALAEKFGVSKALVSAIRYGTARPHLIERSKIAT